MSPFLTVTLSLGGGGGGGGDTPRKIGRRCATSFPKPIFMTKIFDFSYLINDLTKKLMSYFLPLRLAQFP